MSRSLKKGPYSNVKLEKRILAMNESGKKVVVKTWARASMISPDFVGHTVAAVSYTHLFEVKRPELDAVIVANNIARQVEGKIAYRRAIKMAIANTMRMGAEAVSYTHLDVYKRQAYFHLVVVAADVIVIPRS